MFSNLTNQIFTNWHPMRWAALAFGLVLGYNWLTHGAAFSGALSVFFLFQAVTNTGCMVGQCAPAIAGTEDQAEDVEYEEVKN